MKNDQTGILPAPQTLREKFQWLGPGIIWLAAGAGGAGELLFPPRVGSLYGYTFLWILVISMFFKWIIVREIGRWAVCTGSTFTNGLMRLNKPFHWPVWLILVPQLFIATTSIAGLGGTAASALVLFIGLPPTLWMIIAVVASMGILMIARYKNIENASTIVTSILALASIIAAIRIFPPASKILSGFIPSIPPETDYGEILPWLSYVLAGSAGMIWYAQWLPEKGYGKPKPEKDADQSPTEHSPHLNGWIKQMTLDLSIGFIIGTLIVVAFLILGSELLGPEKILPEGNKTAEVLGRMFENVWGSFGYWLMITGIFAGFWGTILTNQDGWAGMLADGVRHLFPNARSTWLRNEKLFKNIIIVVLLTIIPIIIFVIWGEPVLLLQIGGIIQIVFIPFVAWFVLRMNRTLLPEENRPSRVTTILTHCAAICFALLVIMYLATSEVGSG